MSWKRLSIRMYAIFNTQFKFYFTRAKTNKHKKNVKKIKMSNKLKTLALRLIKN